MVYSRELRFITLVNILLLLERGDYDGALDWIDTINEYVIHNQMYGSLYQHAIFEIVIISPFAEPIYDDLLCRLMQLKETFKSYEFKRFYQSQTFFTEESFISEYIQYSEYPFYECMSKRISLFQVYKRISKSLKNKKNILESATWEDIENGVLYNKGKIYNVLQSFESEIPWTKTKLDNYTDFGNGIRGLPDSSLRTRNRCLSYIYRLILILLLEQHLSKNGVYPDNIDNILKNYFSEEEREWIDNYLDIFISPNKYYIDIYAYPKKPKKGFNPLIYNTPGIIRYSNINLYFQNILISGTDILTKFG